VRVPTCWISGGPVAPLPPQFLLHCNLKMASQTILEWVFLRVYWDFVKTVGFLHCSVQNEAVFCLKKEGKKQTDLGTLAILIQYFRDTFLHHFEICV